MEIEEDEDDFLTEDEEYIFSGTPWSQIKFGSKCDICGSRHKVANYFKKNQFLCNQCRSEEIERRTEETLKGW